MGEHEDEDDSEKQVHEELQEPDRIGLLCNFHDDLVSQFTSSPTDKKKNSMYESDESVDLFSELEEMPTAKELEKDDPSDSVEEQLPRENHKAIQKKVGSEVGNGDFKMEAFLYDSPEAAKPFSSQRHFEGFGLDEERLDDVQAINGINNPKTDAIFLILDALKP